MVGCCKWTISQKTLDDNAISGIPLPHGLFQVMVTQVVIIRHNMYMLDDYDVHYTPTYIVSKVACLETSSCALSSVICTL